MDPLPTLTEAIIRQHASSDSYQRGREYYEQGAVVRVVRRDQQLQAEVEGSQYEPYLVQITCDAGGIAQVEIPRCRKEIHTCILSPPIPP